MGIHSMPPFHKILELSFALNQGITALRFCHPMLFLGRFIIPVQAYLPPIQF